MVSLSKIHPFPARMAPSIVQDILRKKQNKLRILDPMSGSGVTLATAASLGHQAIGFDTDPLAILLCSSLTMDLNMGDVVRTTENVLAHSKEMCDSIKASIAYPPKADTETKKYLRFWFCRTSRKQLYCLSSNISKIRNAAVRKVLWVAFSRLIIKKDNGASLAMDVSHSRPHRKYSKAPAQPFLHFPDSVRKVFKATQALNLVDAGQILVKRADARNLPLQSRSVDIVVTSPPYFNAIDYLRAHKMSLVWMGENISYLRSIRSSNIGAEISSRSNDLMPIVQMAFNQIGEINILPLRQQNILKRYVNDMNLVVQEVSRVLAPGGEAYFVIGDSTLKGTFIENSSALKSLAEAHGLEVFESRKRSIPNNRRYLPPPKSVGNNSLGLRMREEVVMGMRNSFPQ